MMFALGQVGITRVCQAHMDRLKASPLTYLNKHANGDWGDLGADDKRANDLAVKHGDSRIFSKYTLPDKEKIYIITEADRSSTTIMLTEEY